jgi:hypothetical protein
MVVALLWFVGTVRASTFLGQGIAGPAARFVTMVRPVPAEIK